MSIYSVEVRKKHKKQIKENSKCSEPIKHDSLHNINIFSSCAASFEDLYSEIINNILNSDLIGEYEYNLIIDYLKNGSVNVEYVASNITFVSQSNYAKILEFYRSKYFMFDNCWANNINRFMDYVNRVKIISLIEIDACIILQKSIEFDCFQFLLLLLLLKYSTTYIIFINIELFSNIVFFIFYLTYRHTRFK